MAEPDKVRGLTRRPGVQRSPFACSPAWPPRPSPRACRCRSRGQIRKARSRPSPARSPGRATPPTNILPAAQAQPNPISNPFAALLGKPEPSAALKPEQRAVIERISNYLSGMQILSGQFVQVGPDGRRTQGEFYIQKPGKVRFEYDAPSPIDIIADGEIGGGARPQSGDAGSSIRCRRRRCASCCPTTSTC